MDAKSFIIIILIILLVGLGMWMYYTLTVTVPIKAKQECEKGCTQKITELLGQVAGPAQQCKQALDGLQQVPACAQAMAAMQQQASPQ